MLGFGPGSRNRKIGTIYQRVKGLIKSGALNSSEKPLWFDVWEAFPPAVQPTYERPISEREISPIIYPEDAIRAKFNKTFLTPLASIKHENPLKVIKTQVFVYEYIKQQSPGKSVDDVIEATIKALQLRDIHFTLKDQTGLDHETTMEDELDLGFKERRWKDVPSKSGPKASFSLDFSDVLGDDGPSRVGSQSIDDKFKLRVTEKDINSSRIKKRKTSDNVMKEKKAINSVDDVDSVIDDLLDSPDSGKIKLDDFYGEANLDLDFMEEDERVISKDKKRVK